MTEPSIHARAVEEVVPGIYRWHLHDPRTDAEGDSHAVVHDGQVTLIDPLPVAPAKLRALGEITTIVLTASCHQRSAWRFRREFDARVYAPVGAVNLEEEPDERYSGGDTLPWQLAAFQTPGPVEQMYALWLLKPRSVLFSSDLLTHDGSGVLRFVPAQYQDDPARTRESVRRLLEQLPVDVVCFGHGPPILANGKQAMQRALDEDTELTGAHPG